jgi:hypothetical protein
VTAPGPGRDRYLGGDLNGLPAIDIPVCRSPQQHRGGSQRSADFDTEARRNGAVREVIEKILKGQGKCGGSGNILKTEREQAEGDTAKVVG